MRHSGIDPSPLVKDDLPTSSIQLYRGHSRELLSGIHLGFFSDRSPPPTCGDDGKGLSFPTVVIERPSSLASCPTLVMGNPSLLRHARHFLSGIHLGFLSDGSPPQPAGMTKGRDGSPPLPTTAGAGSPLCGDDRRGDRYLPQPRRYDTGGMDLR